VIFKAEVTCDARRALGCQEVLILAVGELRSALLGCRKYLLRRRPVLQHQLNSPPEVVNLMKPIIMKVIMKVSG
jgi:hypothetical protein